MSTLELFQEMMRGFSGSPYLAPSKRNEFVLCFGGMNPDHICAMRFPLASVLFNILSQVLQAGNEWEKMMHLHVFPFLYILL